MRLIGKNDFLAEIGVHLQTLRNSVREENGLDLPNRLEFGHQMLESWL